MMRALLFLLLSLPAFGQVVVYDVRQNDVGDAHANQIQLFFPGRSLTGYYCDKAQYFIGEDQSLVDGGCKLVVEYMYPDRKVKKASHSSFVSLANLPFLTFSNCSRPTVNRYQALFGGVVVWRTLIAFNCEENARSGK